MNQISRFLTKMFTTILTSFFFIQIVFSQNGQSSDLSDVNSFTNISPSKKFFQPYLLVDSEYVYPNTTLLAIGDNNKIGLAVNQIADWREEGEKIAYLIDLNDGAIVFQFPYLDLNAPIFGFNDSLLIFSEDKFIKQLNTRTFEIVNLIEVESNDPLIFLGIKNNTLHCSFGSTQIIHYSYDFASKQSSHEVIALGDNSIRGDIEKGFYALKGNSEERLLYLNLINGKTIETIPLTKGSKSDFLVMNFPQILVIKNNVIAFKGEVSVYKTDKASNQLQLEDIHYKFQSAHLTNDNEIIAAVGNKLFVLKLDSAHKKQPSDLIGTIYNDPFEITTLSNDRFMFADIHERTGKLIYQVNIGYNCDYDADYEIYVVDYKINRRNSTNNTKAKATNILASNDKNLSSYFNSFINSGSIKNEPLESDEEKYLRIKKVFNSISQNFVSVADSLTNVLNMLILDSIKVYQCSANSVFNLSNYNIQGEFWRLTFSNPFDGKDFTLIYSQSKGEAKSLLSSNFANIQVSVSYYLNLLNLSYEPLYVTITDKVSQKTNRYIIPFKDLSLLKNLYLTDNSYVNFYPNREILTCRLERGDITYDENIFRYFISNGKPKFFFNYGFDNFYNKAEKVVAMLDLDNPKFQQVLQKEFKRCCLGDNLQYGYEYLRFDSVKYFVNNNTKVYDIAKMTPIPITNEYYYPGKYMIDAATKFVDLSKLTRKSGDSEYDYMFSPNGAFLAIREGKFTRIFGTRNWDMLYEFSGSNGALYWDCNSYFLGIGDNVIPIKLLESVKN